MSGESTSQHDMTEQEQAHVAFKRHFLSTTLLQECIMWLFPKTVKRIEVQAVIKDQIQSAKIKTVLVNEVRLRAHNG